MLARIMGPVERLHTELRIYRISRIRQQVELSGLCDLCADI
jgi:hypothetical protein